MAPASTNRIESDRRKAPRGALRRVMTAFRVPRRSFAIKHRATAANLRYSIDKINTSVSRLVARSWHRNYQTHSCHVEKCGCHAQRSFHTYIIVPFHNSNGYKNSKVKFFETIWADIKSQTFENIPESLEGRHDSPRLFSNCACY